MPKISLIIPVYNVEKYLPRLLDSVINQTFKNFEAILVNDASTDNSGIICDEYAKKDNRIIVHHKAINEGVSSARNTGLDLAKGEYICFSDSDDCLEPFYLECLMGSSAELVIAGVKNVSEDGKLIHKSIFGDSTILPFNKIQLKNMLQNKSIDFIYSKRYLSTVINKNHLRFDKSMSLSEDGLFLIDYIRHCGSIQYIKQTPYIYFNYKTRDTLTKFNNNYIDNLDIGINKKLMLLEKIYPDMQKTFEWNQYVWNLYYYCIFYIIRNPENFKFKQQRKLLKNIIEKKNFIFLVKKINLYMTKDSWLIKKIISTCNATLILLFFKALSLLK